MKFAMVLCWLPAVWLSACSSIPKDAPDEFYRTWSSVVDELNQQRADEPFLRDDLTTIYNAELAAIETAFAEQSSVVKNVFYFQKISLANAKELDTARGFEANNTSSWQMAEKILHKLANHPIASSARAISYDDTQQIGFCFGRALLGHYWLLKEGVLPNHIAKVFALGDFRVGASFWRFHVAVLIKSSDGYVVIDPLYGEPVLLADWQKNLADLEVKRPLSRARFYVTDPRKFMPSSGAYSIDLLSTKEVMPYFFDLGRSLRQ